MSRNIRQLKLNASQFRKAMAREAEQLLPAYAKAFVGGVTASLYEGIAEHTPVLTGRARGSWMLSMAVPSSGRLDPNMTVKAPGTWFQTTGEPLTAKERAQLTTVLARIKAMPLGVPVFITNNQPYIVQLEQGTSAKAPSGMVQLSLTVTLLNADTIANKVALLT